MKAFSLLALCVVLVSSSRGQTTQVSDPQREFATFGVTVIAPAEWKRLAEDSQDMIAKWGIGGQPGQPDVVLTAEMETARGKTLKGYVENLAKQSGGNAQEQVPGLGEDVTWKITFSRPAGATDLQPVASLVAVHEEHLYRVTAYATPTADAEGPLEELRRNWNFCAITRPTQCVALRDEAMTYLDRLTIKPPAVLRPKALPVESKGRALEFQIFNHRSGRADMVMTMEVDKRPSKKTLEEVGQQLIQQMNLKQDPEHPIKWQKLESDRDGVISTSFAGAKSGSRTVPIRFALIDLGAGDLVLLGFVFPTGDKNDQEIYEDLTETMSKTVAPVKK